MLAVRVPHLTWKRAYQLRRVGALRLYRLNASLLRALVS
jgi:hypothetical protein